MHMLVWSFTNDLYGKNYARASRLIHLLAQW